MNVHISYKVQAAKSKDIDKEIEHHLAKLRQRLRAYQPELVHLRVIVDENSPREGFGVSLNLRLPSGQMAAAEHGRDLDTAVKAAFDDLLEQVGKHKEHLRREYKWVRRRRAGRSRPQPQVPFEQTLAAVHPPMASGQDIQSWINANLRRLERYVDRELRYRRNNGELNGDVTREEIVDEVVAAALGEEEQKPEPLGLEAWLYRLAARSIDAVAARNREEGDELPLEASARRQNVRASDEPQLQYHQPDELMTRETITPDRRVATPEDVAASEEMINMVELALLGAPREERDAFILYAIEGFTPEEIAAIADRDIEQVHKAISGARDRLKKTITMPNEFKDKLLQHSKTA
jgi:RNA polymerase sigma factor (sigma-70 family)